MHKKDGFHFCIQLSSLFLILSQNSNILEEWAISQYGTLGPNPMEPNTSGILVLPVLVIVKMS